MGRIATVPSRDLLAGLAVRASHEGGDSEQRKGERSSLHRNPPGNTCDEWRGSWDVETGQPLVTRYAELAPDLKMAIEPIGIHPGCAISRQAEAQLFPSERRSDLDAEPGIRR